MGRQSGVTISFTDREHPTVYKALRLEVIPLTLSMEITPIKLIQGNFVIPITSKNIKILTNGQNSDIICNLGETKNGELLIESKEVRSFTPIDISDGSLDAVFYRTDSLLYYKFENMVIFRSGNSKLIVDFDLFDEQKIKNE